MVVIFVFIGLGAFAAYRLYAWLLSMAPAVAPPAEGEAERCEQCGANLDTANDELCSNCLTELEAEQAGASSANTEGT